MAHRWNVAIMEGSLTRDHTPASYRTIAYKRVTLADTRTEALENCLAEIMDTVLPKITDPTIRRIAVYVGRKGSVTGAASRLEPKTIDRDGNIIR